MLVLIYESMPPKNLCANVNPIFDAGFNIQEHGPEKSVLILTAFLMLVLIYKSMPPKNLCANFNPIFDAGFNI